MSRYDRELYDAWRAGFDVGVEEGRDDNVPVGWILVAEYWAWRRRRKTGQ